MYKLGIDVGGTNTDAVLIDENLLLDGLYYLYQKNHERRRPKK